MSLHHQYSIESFHPDNTRNSPSPLVFFQPRAGFKRWQQRPFHLIYLRKNKACRLPEGENLAIKVPAAYLLGVQLICIISKALIPLLFAFSLLLLESFISASFAMNHQDLKLQTSKRASWVSTSPTRDASQGYLLMTQEKPFRLNHQCCPSESNNNTTISIWKSTTNIRARSTYGVWGERSQVYTMGGFFFIFLFY